MASESNDQLALPRLLGCHLPPHLGTDYLGGSAMSAYEQLAREIAHAHHGTIETIDHFRLDRAQVAVVIRESTNLVAEALGDHEDDIADTLDRNESLGPLVWTLIEAKARRYILKDVLLEQNYMALFQEAV